MPTNPIRLKKFEDILSAEEAKLIQITINNGVNDINELTNPAAIAAARKIIENILSIENQMAIEINRTRSMLDDPISTPSEPTTSAVQTRLQSLSTHIENANKKTDYPKLNAKTREIKETINGPLKKYSSLLNELADLKSQLSASKDPTISKNLRSKIGEKNSEINKIDADISDKIAKIEINIKNSKAAFITMRDSTATAQIYRSTLSEFRQTRSDINRAENQEPEIKEARTFKKGY